MTKNPDPGQSPRLAASFTGRRLLLTGSTGFVGKVVLSTILKKIPNVGKVVCLVRAANDTAAEDRFLKDVVASPALDPVREEHGLGLRDFVRSKVEVKAADLSKANLGLDAASFQAL